VIVLQFQPHSQYPGCRRGKVQSAINGGAELITIHSARAADLQLKTNPADAPVLTLGITSSSMPLSQVEDLELLAPPA